jgi:anthranilate phosphoribosyltransferase
MPVSSQDVSIPRVSIDRVYQTRHSGRGEVRWPPDAPATARWIQSVLAGEQPVPTAIGKQVAAVLQAVGRSAPLRIR